MASYTQIVINPGTAFADEARLMPALAPLLNGQSAGLSLLNYDDGAWSGWYGLELGSGAGDHDYVRLARAIGQITGIGSVMLKDSSGQINAALPVIVSGDLGVPLEDPKPA